MESFDSAKIRSAGGAVLQRPHRVILMHIQHFDSRGNEEMEQMLFSEQKSEALN